MRDEIEFDGVSYVPARRAAEEVGLSRDYIARLCKRVAITGRMVEGTGWYVDTRSLKAFLDAQEHTREYRRQNLVRKRADEYRANYQNGKQVFAASLAPEAFISASSSDVHERLRRALDEKSAPALDAISDTSSIPSGFAHTTFQSMPVQALAHMPVSAIAPAADMLHKVVALATTFLIIAGVFAIIAPSQTAGTLHSVVADAESLQPARVASSADSSLHSMQTLFTIESSKISDPIAYAGAIGGNGSVALQVLSNSSPGITNSNLSVNATGGKSAAAQTAAAASSLSPLGTALAQTSSTAKPTSSPLQTAALASEVPFSGANVSYGDLIAYNASTKTYTLTQGSNDPNAYGIVVQTPALLFKSGDGNVPVLQSGSALMNVTLENGPIAVGDPLTSSSISGKARRANSGENIIGTAGEAFSGQGGVYLKAPDGSQVLSGTILADMNFSGSGGSTPECSSLACRLLSGIDPSLLRAIVRYLLSGLIAGLALFLAFRSFMSDANYGVISMGRNPLAKSSIRSMVLLNAFLAMAIASAGLFAAIVVLFAAA